MAAVHTRSATTEENMDLANHTVTNRSAKDCSEGAKEMTERRTKPLTVGCQQDPKETTIVESATDKDGAMDGANNSEGLQHPQAWKLVAIITALSFAVFLIALDQTIVSTAIPRITDQFHSLNEVAWQVSPWLRQSAQEESPDVLRLYTPLGYPASLFVKFRTFADYDRYGSSYLLTRAALQPSVGRIYSQFDVRPLHIVPYEC